MTHQPSHDQLSAFLDGELDETEAASIEAALQADADLRAELERLRSVQRLLRTHGPARAPEGFAQRVIAAAEADGDNVVAGPWWRRPFGIPVEGVLIAAAAALVLIIALPRGTSSDNAAPGAAVEKDPQEATAAPPPAEAPDAVVDAQGDDEAPDDAVAKVAPPPTPKPRPKAKPTPVVDEQGAGAVDEGAMDNAATPDANAAPEGTDVDPEDPGMASAGMHASLYTEDEEILGAIQATVSRYGGVVRDASNNVVKTGLLVDSETQLVLDVPANRISELTKALGALGIRVETRADAPLVTGSSMRMPLRIVLTGNAPSTDKPAPNAVRKNKTDAYEAADDLLEVEQKL